MVTEFVHFLVEGYAAAGVQAAVDNVNASAEKTSKALVIANDKMLVPRKAPTMPKPQWHAPWKLYRVIFYVYLTLGLSKLSGEK